VISLEDQEDGKEIAEFFKAIVNGKKPFGIKSISIGKCDGIYEDIYVKTDTIIKTVVIGRNDPCPYCLKNGVTVKFKKCKIHNKNA
jgi:hypothetical protein